MMLLFLLLLAVIASIWFSPIRTEPYKPPVRCEDSHKWTWKVNNVGGEYIECEKCSLKPGED
jgi:hypothetical protein